MLFTAEEARTAGLDSATVLVRLAEIEARLREDAEEAHAAGHLADHARASDAQRRALVSIATMGVYSHESVAGDIALAQGADAVVIAGGLGLRLAAHLPQSGFRGRFLAKGRFERRMAAIPVKLAPDQATAEIWASSENHHREQPHAADEIREYGNMAARGVPVPSIAVAFGVSEKHVYRRLKLASLPAPVLDALKAGTITLSNAAAFTISEDETHSLAVL